VNVALLAVESFESALGLLKAAKKDLGEVLSAFEFLDNHSFHIMNKHFPVRNFSSVCLFCFWNRFSFSLSRSASSVA